MEKDKIVIKELSEVIIGNPVGVEDSPYIKHLNGIDVAYKYIIKNSLNQKRQGWLLITFGFVLGILIKYLIELLRMR